MRVSKLFTKTTKNIPADETAKNARLLLQAGYIYKDMAGVYCYLPLGLKVLENIKQIVREEMDKIGSQELLMSTLQNEQTWQQTDRWDEKKVDIWFKTKLQNKTELGLGWSHEEQITTMMKEHVKSYRDLPAYVYQFQNKLRNELRAKSGILRCREFVMKDLYSYTLDQKAHDKFYQKVIDAYHRVFANAGIGKDTYLTFASGGDFTQFSHEFQTICETGEDTIYLDEKKKIAINEEVYNSQTIKKLGLSKANLVKKKAAEVGNIFDFGIKKSQQIGLSYATKTGNEEYVHLGSYGIGITRLMGVLIEKFADDKGIVWPEGVAPYKIYLMALGGKEVMLRAEEMYQSLTRYGVEVLFDDRDIHPGEKFADCDLLGIPYRVVISEKTIAEGGIELKKRTSKATKIISSSELKKMLAL